MSLGPNPVLEKEVKAKTAVTKYRIVKKDTDEDAVSHATAVADKMYAVAQTGGAIGERVRITVAGIGKVEYGGTVVQGDLLTTDASGRAVAAAPAAGVNNRVIGVAMGDYVLNDIGNVLLAPGQIQG